MNKNQFAKQLKALLRAYYKNTLSENIKRGIKEAKKRKNANN